MNTEVPLPELTAREMELLVQLSTSGASLQDAADQMGIAYKTADSYRTELYRKLRVKNRAELVLLAVRHESLREKLGFVSHPSSGSIPTDSANAHNAS